MGYDIKEIGIFTLKNCLEVRLKNVSLGLEFNYFKNVVIKKSCLLSGDYCEIYFNELIVNKRMMIKLLLIYFFQKGIGYKHGSIIFGNTGNIAYFQ